MGCQFWFSTAGRAWDGLNIQNPFVLAAQGWEKGIIWAIPSAQAVPNSLVDEVWAGSKAVDALQSM